jgi:hypothetical protein
MKPTIEKIIGVLRADNSLQALLSATLTSPHVFPHIPDMIETFPCITYEVADDPQNVLPTNTQTLEITFHIFSKTNRASVEDITTRVKQLLDSYKSYTGVANSVNWVRRTAGFDTNETDRQLFGKVLVYRIYAHQTPV